MKPNEKEIEAVFALPASKRAKYLVSKVADWESAWTLGQSDGLALLGSSDGEEALPLWPAERYAELCATEDWSSYMPQQVPLEELIHRLAPDVASANMKFAVFPTQDRRAPILSPEELVELLQEELSKIE